MLTVLEPAMFTFLSTLRQSCDNKISTSPFRLLGKYLFDICHKQEDNLK